METLRPMKAIRAKCLDCTCQQPKEVRLCPIITCALWPYRLGKRPKDGITKGTGDNRVSQKGYHNKKRITGRPLIHNVIKHISTLPVTGELSGKG